MSTNDESVKSDENIYATLVRGRVYFFQSREFVNGVAQLVSKADKEWLEENAVDLVSIEDEGEHQPRQKFSFSTTSAEPAGAKRTRSR